MELYVCASRDDLLVLPRAPFRPRQSGFEMHLEDPGIQAFDYDRFCLHPDVCHVEQRTTWLALYWAPWLPEKFLPKVSPIIYLDLPKESHARCARDHVIIQPVHSRCRRCLICIGVARYEACMAKRSILECQEEFRVDGRMTRST